MHYDFHNDFKYRQWIILIMQFKLKILDYYKNCARFILIISYSDTEIIFSL